MKSICFEGGEGSGKTTVIKNLSKLLTIKGYHVISISEPGTTEVGQKIRKVILDNDIFWKTEVLLFAASRSELISKVIKNLVKNDDNTILILDRYVYSSYVYNNNGDLKSNFEIIKKINNFATDKWKPNICFYLDLDPVIALNRINKNNREVNRIDLKPISFHKEIRTNYLYISDKFSEINKINANTNIEDILNQCVLILQKNNIIN